MKTCLFLLMTGALLSAADEPKQAPKPAAKQASRTERRSPAPPLTVPSGAQEIAPGTWRYQADGKTWIYRQTPWGLTRFEEKPVEKDETKAAKKENEAPQIRAFDDGDYVRFERQGPFGVYKWRSKKTDLSETERQAWERNGKAADEKVERK